MPNQHTSTARTYRKLVTIDKKASICPLMTPCKFSKSHTGPIELTTHFQSLSQEFSNGTPNSPSAITITVAIAIADRQSFFCSGVRK